MLLYKALKIRLFCFVLAAIMCLDRAKSFKKTGVWPESTLSINDTPVLRWKEGATNKDFERLT